MLSRKLNIHHNTKSLKRICFTILFCGALFTSTDTKAQSTTGKHDFCVHLIGDPISQVCLDFIQFNFCDSVSCRSYSLSELINLGTFNAYDGQRSVDSDADPFWEIYTPGGSGTLPTLVNGSSTITFTRIVGPPTSYSAETEICCDGKKYEVTVAIDIDGTNPSLGKFDITVSEVGTCE